MPSATAVRVAAAAPTVGLLAPTYIHATDMTLRGTVKPNELPVTARFEYGTSSTLTGDVQIVQLDDTFTDASGTATVTCFISELRPNTTYYFRLVAVNPTGTSRTDIISMRTAAGSGSY